jgi:hypothetical protein
VVIRWPNTSPAATTTTGASVTRLPHLHFYWNWYH